jgi:ABC-2 type transport system permease protein
VKAGNGWDVHVKLRNDGTGKVPVAIAAVTGDRFDGKGKAVKGYRDARGSATIGKGESQEVVIHCDFQPESVVVDPDYMVLQLERRNATVKL